MADRGNSTPRTFMHAEPLENRALLSADDGTAPISDDGTNRVPAAEVIVQLREKLAAQGVPAAGALGKVLQLPPFTGFFHS